MLPEPGTVLHFSEDPAITRFAPHVAATARQPTPYVWAVDAADAPAYWFPRQCPRAMAWAGPETIDADRDRLLGAAPRVHLIEYDWLEALRTVELYAYSFDAAEFVPIGTPWPHAMVADHPVRPIGRARPVGDLLALHAAAGIELRLAPRSGPGGSG